jgi:hypothetical protein
MEEHFPLRARQEVMAAELQTIATLNQGCVSHQIARISMFVRGCVIDVLTVPNADQVGYFRKKKGLPLTRSMAPGGWEAKSAAISSPDILFNALWMSARIQGTPNCR